jgi:hypothetical protein
VAVAPEDIWIRRRERRLGEPRQHSLDLREGLGDFGEQPLARQPPRRELERPIAHVAGPAEDRADEVLQISADVERQGADGVGDAGQGLPDPGLVGKKLDLARESAQFTTDEKRRPGAGFKMGPFGNRVLSLELLDDVPR